MAPLIGDQLARFGWCRAWRHSRLTFPESILIRYSLFQLKRRGRVGNATPWLTKESVGPAAMSDSSIAFLRLADQARSRIIEVTPKDVSRAKPLPLFIDIRETEEYTRGHIAGARHLSRGVLEQKIGEVVPDLSTPLVVYCDRGERAALAAETSSTWVTRMCDPSRADCKTG